VPVVGAQIAAGHLAVGGAFDGNAVFDWYTPNAITPLTDQHLMDADLPRQIDGGVIREVFI
jgi:hypothetical protein